MELLTPPSNIPFSWQDCLIVVVVIFIFNIMTGIYFNYFARQNTTTNEYLMGGRKMKVLPIVISLIASHTSANTLLSVPTDVYRYGAGYLLGGFSTVIISIVTIYVYLPVFYNLKITSIYEYLERRFDYRTRLFASFLSVMSFVLYLPIVIYVPSLAFSTATGINVHVISTSLCALCIFYTAIGGLKAVVWTDTMQFLIAMVALTVVFVQGLNTTGGFGMVWKKAVDSKRLDIFDFDVDPTKRDTFWSLVIGLTTYRIATVSCAQSCVQKFLAVSSFKQSVLSVVLFGLGTVLVKTFAILLGLVIYAKYSECDPVSAQQIKTDNQLATLFVTDVSKNITGLSGLFMAGVFSASLSTVSADLNCLAGIIYEDFISKVTPRKITERNATSILKILVIVSGVTCTLMIHIIQHLGGLFALAMSLGGVTGGSIAGMFTLGMLFPTSNAKGAFYGGICGLVVTSAVIFPSQYYQMHGYLYRESKPVSIKGCEFLNDTIVEDVEYDKILNFHSEHIPSIFRLSFYYYVALGSAVTIVLGLLISYLTRENNYSVDKKFLSPVCYRFIDKKLKSIDKI